MSDEKVEYDKDSLAGELAAAFDDATEEVIESDDEGVIDEQDEQRSIDGDIEGSTDDDRGTTVTPDIEASTDDQAGQKSQAEVDNSVDTPPSSLPPAAREAWGETPQAMKEAIAKREKDYEAGIVKYAENAKRAQSMDKVLQPYQQYLATNGGAGSAIKTLLNTGAQLQGGSPQQKAAQVAGIIKNFGVDIKMLDDMLVGQAPQEDPNAPVQQAVQQAIAPYQQQLEALQQRQLYEQQQLQSGVNTELEQFAATHEFYKDVSQDMADIMDMASKRGLNPSLEEVYNKACMIHPEIGPIIQARSSGQQTQAKRKAAVSISGGPGGPGEGAAAPDTMTDAINAAWDAHAKVGR